MLASVIVSTGSATDNLPLIGVVLAAALYVVGLRRRLRLVGSHTRRRGGRWRIAAFAAALATIVVALQQPLDGLADSLFSVHMAQHLLLMVVAAPLLVLAAPWQHLWRGLPLDVRRPLARALVLSGWAAPLRRLARLSRIPLAAWLLFNVDLLAWHVPYLYDLTLRNQDVHDLEHLSFLVFGVLFWAQVVDSPPLRCRLAHLQRAAFVLSAMVVGWLLAIVLAFAGAPLYAPYAALATRPGGLSALGDQQLGAGVMWGPGTVPFAIALFALLYRWLDEAHHRPATEIRPPLKGLAGGHT